MIACDFDFVFEKKKLAVIIIKKKNPQTHPLLNLISHSRSSSLRSTNVEMHQTSSPNRQHHHQVDGGDDQQQPKIEWSSTTSSSHVTVIKELSSSPGAARRIVVSDHVDGGDITAECRAKQQNRLKTKVDHTKYLSQFQVYLFFFFKLIFHYGLFKDGRNDFRLKFECKV